MEKEEELEEARAAEVRAKKHLAEESKNTTVDDLTRGIVNYKYLGLDFEKAENQKLRYDSHPLSIVLPFSICMLILQRLL